MRLGLGFGLHPADPGWGFGACVFVCALRLCPAIPGWCVRCGCVCLGAGFGCAPPFLAGVFGSVFCCLHSVWTPPILASVRDVGVCAWARVSAAPHHSWLGFWVVYFSVHSVCTPRILAGCAVLVFVLGLGLRLRPAIPGWGFGACAFVCALLLYGAIPGWGVPSGCVCLDSGFRCTAPFLAGVLGCVFWCLRSVCTPPILTRVCVPDVCPWARVSAAPRQSWLGCWALCFACALCLYSANPSWRCAVCVCVFGLGFRLRPVNPCWGVGLCALVCALRLYSANPCSGVRCGCVCLGSGFGCALPVVAGLMGCVFSSCCFACTPPILAGMCAVISVPGLGFRLRPAIPGWGFLVCVCVFVPALRLYPANLAGVCGVAVCAWARLSAASRLSCLGCWVVCFGACASPVPRNSWLGCAVWVCVLGLGFRLRPAISGWSVVFCVLVCALRLYPANTGWAVRCGYVCLGSGFGCAPPFLAGMLGCVCRCAPSACTPPFLAGVSRGWAGCCLAPVPVPWFVADCARCPGLRHPVAVVAWHLSVCLCCCRQRASLACLRAPRWCAVHRPVWSLSVLQSAFTTPWCLS